MAPIAWNVVIAGGGFGGFHTARRLERALAPQSARVTLVTDLNYLTYTPFLPATSGGNLETRHVVAPLRELLPRTDLRLRHVVGADPERQRLLVTRHDGQEEEVPYDRLVVAVGSISRTLPIPGLAENAIGFKTLAEALALRNQVVSSLEMAESFEDPAERQSYLNFVFVGAGYAGLEALAELQDYAAHVIQLYPRCRLQGMRWILVEARDRVMPEIPADLADFAVRELQARGIEILTNTTVEEVTDSSVRLSTGEDVPTRTCAWTAGVKPHPVVARLGLPLDAGGRIVVDSYMQVQGRDDVWAIGDAAAVPDPARKGQACPPTSQHAQRQGKRVAGNVAASLGTGKRRKFTYRTLGVFVDMGRGKAVASTVGIKWRGFPAWFMARSYHVMQVPGKGRRLRLIADQTAGLVFERDSSEFGQLGHVAPLGGDTLANGRGPAESNGADDPQVRQSTVAAETLATGSRTAT